MDRVVFDRSYTAYDLELDPTGLRRVGLALAISCISPEPQKLAGWIRLSFPVAVSLALWFPILLTLRNHL